MFGIKISEFERILKAVEPEWEKRVVSRYKRPGRNYKLDLADLILMLLLYYRSYTSPIFIGFLFGIDDSRVCRNIRTLEPILATVMAISKTRHLRQEEVKEIIIDATEHPIERPKKGQKAFYSRKRKRHTNKTEIRITPQKRSVHASKTKPGAPFMILPSIKRNPLFLRAQQHWLILAIKDSIKFMLEQKFLLKFQKRSSRFRR